MSDYTDYLEEVFAQFGEIEARRMFGGHGLFHGGLMFALVADDMLYLKADETSSHAFADEGMEPFTYTAKGGKPIAMSYWEVPPRLLEEPDELAEWAREAHRIACAQKKPSRKSSKKRKSA